MAKTPTYKTTVPTTAAGLGGSNYANVTIAGGSGSGLVYTTATGASPIWTTATAAPYYTQQPKVKITDSDIEIDGLSLKATMQAVNERLAIMVPNPRLETEFEELKALADRYRELERKLLDQKVMWETLKKTDQ